MDRYYLGCLFNREYQANAKTTNHQASALAEWQDAWLTGYRSHRAIAAADEAMLPSFVLLRRLLLLAWMGTHSHSKESRTKAITYADGSCVLAERYLSSNGRRLA